MMKNVGYAGTWGPGANVMNNIHVKDCAAGLLLVLQAALEGKADEGAEGICGQTLKLCSQCALMPLIVRFCGK